MKYSVFDDCKAALDMTEVSRFYGFPQNRAGFICCPFHSEKTASMKLYKNGYHCFGCGASGSVIDFAGQLLGLSALDAVKRLNEDFHLGLQIDRAPPDLEDQRQQQRIREARKGFEAWKNDFLSVLDAAIYVANNADYTNLTRGQAVAIAWREHFEYLADQLLHGTIEQQISIFRDRWEVVERCKTILPNTLARSSTT